MFDKNTKLAGFALILMGLYINIPFGMLGIYFDYPGILRKPAGEILIAFEAGGDRLIFLWYAFAAAGLLFLVVSQIVHSAFRERNEDLSRIAAVFGALAGILQAIGLLRWVFVVPMLANIFVDPASSDAERHSVSVVFNAMHQFVGVAIGEHLGQLFTALWVLTISIMVLPGRPIWRTLGWTGIVVAVTMLVGLAEGFATVLPFDAAALSLLTPISFIALSIWMAVLGCTLVHLSLNHWFVDRLRAWFRSNA